MLPEALVQPNLRAFPTSRKRKMTGREATEQQERDEARECRRAQQHCNENEMWARQMVDELQLRFGQRESQTQLVPDTQPDTQLSELSKTPSISSLESLTDSSADMAANNPNPQARRTGRVRKPTRDKASQLSQEETAVIAKAKDKKKGKGQKMRNLSLYHSC